MSRKPCASDSFQNIRRVLCSGRLRVQPRAEEARRRSARRTVHLLGLRGELERSLTLSRIERLPRRLAQPPPLHRDLEPSNILVTPKGGSVTTGLHSRPLGMIAFDG